MCAPACATGSCSDHGICTDNVGVVICVCDDGYDGDACETDVDDCVGVACLQGAACVDEVDGFHCDCPTGYGGTLCDACATGYQDEDADGVCAVDCTLTTCADHESCSV
ncbi:MAG: calcium-binding EGF-like domain-containing protein, partial [Myxococcales bacterium]|nr:calcium-binding EGF-like domain-containing protein [Myxococcales bacterium]